MTSSNGTTSSPPKLVVTPPNHSILQRHPTMAPRPLPQTWSLSSPQLIAHSMASYDATLRFPNGTASTAPCNGTLVPRPIRQSGLSPSPLLEVRIPIAIAIWGIIFKNMPLLYQHIPQIAKNNFCVINAEGSI